MLPVGDFPLKIQPDSDELRCVLVKLTDSSVKSIEEYLKNKNNLIRKPSIVFQRDRGEIIFPIDPNDPKASKRFQFSLSSVKESNKDSSASSQCIAFSNSRLKTIGKFEQKLTVQANDDVFLATKEKVNKEAEEEKRNSTKEIKPSGALVNRNTPTNSGSTTASVNRLKQPNLPKPSIAPTVTNTPSASETIKPRPAVLDRPLRERLIHTLAFKSGTKHEIISRINKDNVLSEKEKQQLEELIQSVSVFNPKLNVYELSTEILLNEVREEWQFYFPHERVVVKKNIARARQIQTASPQMTQQASAAANSLKKSAEIGVTKQSMPSAFVPLSKSGASTSSLNKSLVNSPGDTASSKNMTSYKSAGKLPESGGGGGAGSYQAKSGSKRPESKTQESFAFSPSSDLESESVISKKSKEKENVNGAKKIKSSFEDKQKEIEENELNECSKKYKRISSRSQRDQYQQDYDQVYEEYLELHKLVDVVASTFQKYQQELSQIRDDSSREYQEKKKRVVSDYLEKVNDPEYAKKRERYVQVYTRLNYIHDLCKQYDSTA